MLFVGGLVAAFLGPVVCLVSLRFAAARHGGRHTASASPLGALLGSLLWGLVFGTFNALLWLLSQWPAQ
jgi:hypothetical protein